MDEASLTDRITRAPLCYDTARAEETATSFADQPSAVQELLSNTASCSGYLARLMEREADWLREALLASPEQAMDDVLASMPADSVSDLTISLRVAKRRAALLIALADLGGTWSLDEVTGALTDIADRATQLALKTLVAAEIGRGKLPGCKPEDAEDAAGMFVIAMGKMGARELNYSSDIDLIVLFDETRYEPDDYARVRKVFIRVTQRLVKMLSEITGDGYVFRTDLRLRPDPSVTPVCFATEPAEHYYESLGRTWERSAYIKARICAGAMEAGNAFLERLRPFVWRRHLDYAAIQDAHDMRERIRSHKGLTGPLQAPGHNIKLGQGGIREIEFFTQTRQLILGGRNPDLRDRRTLPALAALARKGWVDPEAAKYLTEAYTEHRTLEHRLQMVEDAQTQMIPASREGMDRIAAFCGSSDTEAFSENLRSRFRDVHQLTEPFFTPDKSEKPEAPSVNEVFREPDKAAELMEGWQRLPALRTSRARAIFTRLEPLLLQRMATAHDPDEALRSLDVFLSGLPSGVQLFSLMEANPPLLELLIDICGTTPELARYLGRNAGVFDAVLSPDFYQPLPGVSALAQELSAVMSVVSDYETALNQARIWMKERHFRIGVHLLRGIAGPDETAFAYSSVADALLITLLPVVKAEFAKRHGPPPGDGATIVAMGKLGSREMTVSSDLDLLVIYDARGETASAGKRPLPVSTYYARLTQALIAALSAPMADGFLYKVDMRLRPSGRQGPVATSLPAFITYQLEEAWTWEHLALTRARAISGSPALQGAANDAIRKILSGPRDAAKTLADVSDMRARLAETHDEASQNPWATKRGPGRMLDIELLAQTGALIHNVTRVRRSTRMLDKLQQVGWLSAAEVFVLYSSLQRLATLQQIGRLASGRAIDPAKGGDGLVRLVLSLTGANDLQCLQTSLETEASACAEIITRRLSRQ